MSFKNSGLDLDRKIWPSAHLFRICHIFPPVANMLIVSLLDLTEQRRI